MNELRNMGKYHRLTYNGKVFRIYDCLDRGYVVMTDGKVIGTADNNVQAMNFAKAYTQR